MIKFNKIENSKPYSIFKKLYDDAINKNQDCVEAISISSYNPNLSEVNARYVNLKYIIDNKWYFFSNYNSPKSIDFDCHNQIATSFFWSKINTQIRIKAKIFKASENESNSHFNKRDFKKNILAISSNQSNKIDSYELIESKYKDVYQKHLDKKTISRPLYWGGFYFIPYYFEFWEGHKDRLNKRKCFEYIDSVWTASILEP